MNPHSPCGEKDFKSVSRLKSGTNSLCFQTSRTPQARRRYHEYRSRTAQNLHTLFSPGRRSASASFLAPTSLCGDTPHAPDRNTVALRATFFRCPGGCPRSRLWLFFRASRTRPRRKRIALRVFGPPNFPNAVGRSLFQKIGSPEKVASNPISLALVVPRLCANHMRERHSPRLSALRRGLLWKARQAKTRLDSGCGSGSTQAEP